MPNSPIICCRCSPATKTKLEELAKEHGVTLSLVIAKILDEHLYPKEDSGYVEIDLDRKTEGSRSEAEAPEGSRSEAEAPEGSRSEAEATTDITLEGWK